MSVVTEHRNAKATEASLKNERITRQRVDRLESWAGAVVGTITPMSDLLDYMDTGVWVRLRWLVLGNAAITPKRAEPTEDQVSE